MNNQKTIVDKIFEILLSFSVLGMAFILVVGVFARTVLKYSLQGTTQGRYLTGGVPPVRFSM